MVDLYRLVAEPRGIAPYEIPRDERLALARSVMPFIWPAFETTVGTQRTDLLEVVDYDDAWPDRFEEWRGRIAVALGPVARRIDHVGSTSVPGLPAKPIIDIQVAVTDPRDEDAYVPSLADEGLALRSRDELHRYFRPLAGHPRAVHVHVCPTGSPWERDHLVFRDYLRTHPDDARRYTETKRRAVELWSDDGWGNNDAKTDVILDILEAANDWAAASGWRV